MGKPLATWALWEQAVCQPSSWKTLTLFHPLTTPLLLLLQQATPVLVAVRAMTGSGRGTSLQASSKTFYASSSMARRRHKCRPRLCLEMSSSPLSSSLLWMMMTMMMTMAVEPRVVMV